MKNNRKVSAKTVLMETLEQLLHKKPFQKISVNELCQAALVSRSAFYANFEDKYHLLACCLEAKKEEIDALTETHSPEEFLTVILEFIQQENRFFFNTFASDPERETLDILYTSFEKHFVSLLKEREADGLVLPGPPEVVISFFIGGLATSTLRWIKSNYKIPKEELAACQHRLLEGIL